jgi:hypothetical protein
LNLCIRRFIGLAIYYLFFCFLRLISSNNSKQSLFFIHEISMLQNLRQNWNYFLGHIILFFFLNQLYLISYIINQVPLILIWFQIIECKILKVFLYSLINFKWKQIRFWKLRKKTFVALIKDLKMFLHIHSTSFNSSNAVDIVRENIYLLCQIQVVSFILQYLLEETWFKHVL